MRLNFFDKRNLHSLLNQGMPKQHGQSIVIIAFLLVGLIAFLGLVFDGGSAYAERRLMQNAADSGEDNDEYRAEVSHMLSTKKGIVLALCLGLVQAGAAFAEPSFLIYPNVPTVFRYDTSRVIPDPLRIPGAPKHAPAVGKRRVGRNGGSGRCTSIPREAATFCLISKVPTFAPPGSTTRTRAVTLDAACARFSAVASPCRNSGTTNFPARTFGNPTHGSRSRCRTIHPVSALTR